MGNEAHLSSLTDEEEIFIRHILKEREAFLLETAPLACRRARRRSMILHGAEPWFGRLSVVLWALATHQVLEWKSLLTHPNRIGVPRSYIDWEIDFLGKSGRFNYGFVVQLMCLWWNRTALAPWKTLSDRVVTDIHKLVDRLYHGIDPAPYIVGKDPKEDEILGSVVSLLKQLREYRNKKEKILQIGIGEGRLAQRWKADKDKDGVPTAHNEALIALDYQGPFDNKYEEKYKEKILDVVTKAKCGNFYSYDRNLTMVYDPYAPNGPVWMKFFGDDSNKWCKSFPIEITELAAIVEVFHEVETTQFVQFVRSIDQAMKGGGVCLIEDIFYLHHSVERDFCLYRSDEIAKLFQIFGWRTIDVPCWEKTIAVPYSLILATKPDGSSRIVKRFCQFFTRRKKINKLISQIRRRQIKRIDDILKAWKWRTMLPNEIREHFYTVLSLANLMRWQEK